MKKKSTIWLVLWGISIGIGSLFSLLKTVLHYIENSEVLSTPPYAGYQLFLLLFFVPLCLIPMLAVALYHAIQENNKTIKIVTSILIVQHIICFVAVLLQTIS